MKKYAALYIIRFADDEPDEERVLHVGSREECDLVVERCPVVVYSGQRTVKSAEAKIGVNWHDFKIGELFTGRPDP